jgi:hypothetical protein
MRYFQPHIEDDRKKNGNKISIVGNTACPSIIFQFHHIVNCASSYFQDVFLFF